MAANVPLGSLPSSRKTLVELMRRLHYGQILELHLRGGDPAFDPVPRLVRDVKLASEPAPRLSGGHEDFLLKQQVLELFRLFDEVQDGLIDLIEVKDGLPFRVKRTEPLG